MTVDELRIDQIRCGPRKRPLDQGAVADIAKSIEQQGLLQAIGVKPLLEIGDQFEVVFGAHRLAAMAMLQRETISAYILSPDLADEAYQLIELQENSARNDLTGTQRKAYAAEIGRLLSHLAENSHIPTGNDQWFSEMGKTGNIPQTTLYTWWADFCKATQLSLTPKQALDIHKQQFFAWLDEQKRKEDAANAQRIAGAHVRRQEKAFESALDHLESLLPEYGFALVKTHVIDVFCDNNRC
jgi:ParB-like nuclease domain